jgi:hypothetical protein
MGEVREVPSGIILRRFNGRIDSELSIMLLTLPPFMLTWIDLALRRTLPSAPSSGSLVCDRCGFAIESHVEAGTVSSTFVIDFFTAKQSRYRHVLAATRDGKLSISCVPFQSVATESTENTGATVGISSIEKSSNREP